MESVTRQIRGVELTVTPFSAQRALGLLPRAAKFAQPFIAALPDTLMLEVVATMDGEELQALSADLLAGTQARVDGKAVDLVGKGAIDRVFSGDVLALVDAMYFAVEVNYAGFFAGGSATSSAGPTPAG